MNVCWPRRPWARFSIVVGRLFLPDAAIKQTEHISASWTKAGSETD